MPELPEVETVKNALKRQVLHKQIKLANIYWNNIIAFPKPEEFKEKIKNQTINDILRRGKWLMFELNDYYLLSHLRMEGKYFIRNKDDERNKHEHVILEFTDNTELRYHDTRKFGKMYLIKKEDTYVVKPLSELGLEYNDSSLTVDYLLKHFKNKKLPIKTVLLDQSIITGIGNIYDDEILFLSKINPFRKACDISSDECGKIIKNTYNVLEKAINLGGTTIKSFTSSEGVHGMFQNELLVHGKGGMKCPNCGSILLKTKINGRGTHYCEKCQK